MEKRVPRGLVRYYWVLLRAQIDLIIKFDIWIRPCHSLWAYQSNVLHHESRKGNTKMGRALLYGV
jgi:hypothetical protein